jgi:branched-chain amino acid:cation transporter, LIVCS family
MSNAYKMLHVVPIGFAMFSMFFGSGNVVFPVLVGVGAAANSIAAFSGLFITAILLPFVGLIAMFMYEGSYFKFFNKLGAVPAWLIIICIMGLIGPFGVIPRCIVISFSALQQSLPSLSLGWFSFVSCILIFIMSYKRSRILDILGLFLTPILIVSLLTIVLKGMFTDTVSVTRLVKGSLDSFRFGLSEGYNTMDILASFIFSGVILKSISSRFAYQNLDKSQIINLSLRASIIGMLLLAGVYLGLGFVASKHFYFLQSVPAQKLLIVLGEHLLGRYSGLVVSACMSLACLTTAISLALVFSEFLSTNIFKTLSYRLNLFMTVVVACFFSLLDFTGIQAILVPILQVLMPSLIMLTLCNIFSSKYERFPVKLPVFLCFALSLYFYCF